MDDDTVLRRGNSAFEPEDATQISKRPPSAQRQQPQLVEIFVEDEPEVDDATQLVTRPQPSVDASVVAAQEESEETVLVSRPSAVDAGDDSTVMVQRAEPPEGGEDQTLLVNRRSVLPTHEDSTRISSRNTSPPGEDATRLSARNFPADDSTRISARLSSLDDATQLSQRNPDDTIALLGRANQGSVTSAPETGSDTRRRFFKEPEVTVGSPQVFTRGMELPSDDIERTDFSDDDDERMLFISDLDARKHQALKNRKKRGIRLVLFVMVSMVAIGAAIAVALFLVSV